MNEIISTLERAKEKANAKLVAVKAFPICTDALDYRAVFEMAYDHLRDTIYLFQHARKLKQKLNADSRLNPPPAPGSDLELLIADRKWAEAHPKEKDAPD